MPVVPNMFAVLLPLDQGMRAEQARTMATFQEVRNPLRSSLVARARLSFPSLCTFSSLCFSPFSLLLLHRKRSRCGQRSQLRSVGSLPPV
jgi:hypothetical protein